MIEVFTARTTPAASASATGWTQRVGRVVVAVAIAGVGVVGLSGPASAVGTVTTYALGAGTYPYAGVFDSAGNFFSANEGTSTISKITPVGVVTQVWATLPASTSVEAIAIDSADNLYTANLGLSTVSKVSPAAVVTAVWATMPSGSYPEGIVVDSSDNVYVGGNSTNIIVKITPAGGVATTWATLPSGAYPYGLAIDATDNVYSANQGNNTISKVTSAGVLSAAWASLPSGSGPMALAFDSVGNLYTGNWGNYTVSKVTAAASVTGAWATMLGSVAAVAVDSDDNVYTSNYQPRTIGKITPGGTATQTWASLPGSALSTGLAVSPSDDIYSSNSPGHSITVMEADATAPGAPTALVTTAGDTQASLTFNAPVRTGHSAITGYEVSVDGLTWAPLTTSGSGPYTATVTGLSNGSTYPVRVRAVNAIGNGTPSQTVSVTPAAPPAPPAPPVPPAPQVPAAPSAPTAVAGTASATVSWAPSATSTVTGYTVTAHPGPATCVTTSFSATGCVIGAVAGTAYTYTVVAHSPAGDSPASGPSNAVTATAPEVPPTPPIDAPTTLTTTDGTLTTVEPSQPVIVIGTGFAPYSTAKVVIYSTPIVLATVTTDSAGDFSAPVTVPADLESGAHTFIASGTDPTGAVRQLQMPVTITAATDPVTPPTKVRAAAGNKKLTVSFDPATAPAPTTITGYQVSTDGGKHWTHLNTSGATRLSATLTGLRNGVTYTIKIRALTLTGTSAGTGMPTAALTIKLPLPWFHDPLSATARKKLVAVPAHPKAYHGKQRTTRAAYRSHNGTIAVPASWAKGHHLSKGQAATLTGDGLFAFNSAVITKPGTRQLRTLAASLKGNDQAITCEGYTDYAGDAAHEKTLSRRRATAVCSALTSFGVRAAKHSIGYGRARPVTIGGTPHSRAANRRVVINVTR